MWVSRERWDTLNATLDQLAADAAPNPDAQQLPAPMSAKSAHELLAKPACDHCGGYHSFACPRVRKLVRTPTGVTEVVYWAWDEWPKDNIAWPDELAEILAADEQEQPHEG